MVIDKLECFNNHYPSSKIILVYDSHQMNINTIDNLLIAKNRLGATFIVMRIYQI